MGALVYLCRSADLADHVAAPARRVMTDFAPREGDEFLIGQNYA